MTELTKLFKELLAEMLENVESCMWYNSSEIHWAVEAYKEGRVADAAIVMWQQLHRRTSMTFNLTANEIKNLTVLQVQDGENSQMQFGGSIYIYFTTNDLGWLPTWNPVQVGGHDLDGEMLEVSIPHATFLPGKLQIHPAPENKRSELEALLLL